MTTPAITRPAETEALLTALDRTEPGALTACGEWTARDLAAHLAAACDEIARHVHAYAEGQPLTRTRGFEEREAPFRELPPTELLAALDLGNFDLLKHAVTAIGTGPMTARGVAAGAAEGPAFTARIRSEGHPDLVVGSGDSGVRLALADPENDAAVTTDQAARLLLLWGRTPQPPARVLITGPRGDALRARRLLAGY